MRKKTQERRLLEALTGKSLYTYEFDVSTDLIREEIIDRNGINFTKILGLEIPCAFDTLIEKAFGSPLTCRYTSESDVTSLSRQVLLDAFENGRTKCLS